MLWLNLGPFVLLGHCRTGSGNWTPPKAKKGGRTTEKISQIGLVYMCFFSVHFILQPTNCPA